MAIPSRTRPTFTLTHSLSLEVRRKGMGYYDNDGFWVTSPDTVIAVEANVQPMSDTDLMLLPESERTKEWIKIYSAEQVREAKEGPSGWEADFVVWEGDVYRVMKSRHYVMGILDHWRAMAAREPLSAQGV